MEDLQKAIEVKNQKIQELQTKLKETYSGCPKADHARLDNLLLKASITETGEPKKIKKNHGRMSGSKKS